MWKKEKIKEDGLLSRIVAFADRYDSFLSSGEVLFVLDFAKKEDYDSIKEWLRIKPGEDKVPLTLSEFSFLTKEQIDYYQALWAEQAALVDEKKSLYGELISYEK